MRRLPPTVFSRLLPVGLFLPLILAQSAVTQTAIQRVQVLGGKDAVEIEVEASDRIVPQTQLLSGPDRLVVDFPNAVPGVGLRNQSVEQGDVKDVRFGLFQNKPPVTRIVLDLKSAEAYQVFPGRTVIIKIGGDAPENATRDGDLAPQPAMRPGLVAANYTTRVEPIRTEGPGTSDAVQPAVRAQIQNPEKPVEVSFRDGLLSIKSNKATLSEVLFAVQQRTGAEIGIVAGAEQEKVVVDLGPAPAPEVLSQLLNGSKFNFLIVSAENNPQKLERVILTPKVEGLVVSRITPVPANASKDSDDDDDDKPARPTPPPPVNARPPAQPPAQQQEIRPPEYNPGEQPQ